MQLNNTVDEKKTKSPEMLQLDASCKKILSNKLVLAYLVKTCVSEFSKLDISDIEKLIDDGVSIGPSSHAVSLNTENHDDVEGKIIYDLLFYVKLPNNLDEGILVNVEAQKSTANMARKIKYMSRLIHYQENHRQLKVKKAVSIWVLMNPAIQQTNTINAYLITERQLIGAYKATKESYGIVRIIDVGLGKYEEGQIDVLLLLNLIFKSDMDIEEKEKIIKSRLNIDLDLTLRKEMTGMCDFSLDYMDIVKIEMIKRMMKFMTLKEIIQKMKLTDEEIELVQMHLLQPINQC